MASMTIFGILGNLAHEIGSDDISSVVRAGTGLAFISYPEALAKFTVVPQLFAVLFFLMLFVLGIGTTVAFCNVIVSVIKDQFPQLNQWKIAAGVAIFGFSIGIVYCTPVSFRRRKFLLSSKYKRDSLSKPILLSSKKNKQNKNYQSSRGFI